MSSEKLLSDAERVLLQPVQWRYLPYIEEHAPISDADYEVLREIREILVRHGYQKRFGVCLIHKHFELNDNEIALEETDTEARISTIRVVEKDTCNDAMETAWQFDDGDEIRSGRNCTLKCRGYGMTGHSRLHECKPT